jgi:hypothetical protein
MTDDFTFVARTNVGRRTFVVERASPSGASSAATPRDPGARPAPSRWIYRTTGHLGETIQLDAGACDGPDETETEVQSRVVSAFDQYIQHRPASL